MDHWEQVEAGLVEMFQVILENVMPKLNVEDAYGFIKEMYSFILEIIPYDTYGESSIGLEINDGEEIIYGKDKVYQNLRLVFDIGGTLSDHMRSYTENNGRIRKEDVQDELKDLEGFEVDYYFRVILDDSFYDLGLRDDVRYGESAVDYMVKELEKRDGVIVNKLFSYNPTSDLGTKTNWIVKYQDKLGLIE